MYIYSSLLSTRASPRFNFVGNNIASLRLQTKKPKGMRTNIEKISRVPAKRMIISQHFQINLPSNGPFK